MVQDSRFTLRGSPRYMSRMHRDLRPIVLAGAFFAILWSLTTAISSFRNVQVFNNNNDTRLGLLYIILGAIYIGVMIIEVFGIFAGISRRLALVRIFAYLSILVTLMVAGAGLLQTIIHFNSKNDIINVCSNITTGDRIIFTGFFGPIDGGAVSRREAEEWCHRQYDRDSFSVVVALLATTAVAALFILFIFAYLRQLRDPTSIANVSREPVRLHAFPAPYNPPYNPPFQYPAPNGPPPHMSTDAFVPPYESADTKPPTYEGGDFQGGFKGDLKGERKDDPFWDGRHD